MLSSRIFFHVDNPNSEQFQQRHLETLHKQANPEHLKVSLPLLVLKDGNPTTELPTDTNPVEPINPNTPPSK